MLTLALASLLAAPPAGGVWSVTLQPAIVVPAEDSAPAPEQAEAAETGKPQAQEAPRLAPAKPLAPRARGRQARTRHRR